MNRLVEWYKALLVAKGNTQTYGIDYLDVFALVTKMNTIKISIPLSTLKNWPLIN